MATKYITLVTNKQTNKILTHFLYYLSGAYSNWEYNDKSSENFCEYTPFMFAFVILILEWVLGGINLCLGVVTDRENQQNKSWYEF